MSFWDERYSEPGFAYGTEPNDFLRAEEARLPRGSRILCLAEGEGRNSVFLASRGHRVLAVDQSTVGLSKLARFARERGVVVETVCADLAEFKIEDGGFDAVISIWCHLPPELRRRVHSDVVRSLRPGGVLILEAYHPRQLEFKTGGPSSPELLMTVELLRKELAGLEFEILVQKERDIREGPYHCGQSAVVQCAARKPAPMNSGD